MDENETDPPRSPSALSRLPDRSGLKNAEIIALSLSIVWLLAITVFFFVVGTRGNDGDADPLRGMMVIFAAFMPIALIWIAALAASSIRTMREQAQDLQSSVESLRHAYVTERQSNGSRVESSLERKLDKIAAAQKETDKALAKVSTAWAERAVPPPSAAHSVSPSAPSEAQAQPLLDLPETAPAHRPVAIGDFIKAMNFPETAEDAEGFQALRTAMQDHRVLPVIQASQDILTMLSQEGIYMDDMIPDTARPELWRRFAQGERGRPISALGGVRDRSGIALTAARMRKDHVFRDTAHHFLRKFDKILTEFEKHATDAEIVALSDTRTARAFMLLGRVAGMFD